MADPGFPVGGHGPRGGGIGVDSRGGYVSKILYVKRKNLDPWGGGSVRRASANVDPPMFMDFPTISPAEQLESES